MKNYYKIEVSGFYSASTRSNYRPVSLLLRALQYNLTTGLTLIILFRIFIERFEIAQLEYALIFLLKERHLQIKINF
jgi:hypothetical protein